MKHILINVESVDRRELMKRIMGAKGILISKLAQTSGVGVFKISRYINGWAITFTDSEKERLAETLELSVADLFGEEDR